MPTVSQALEIALAHHRAGRLELAAEIYRRILAAEPGHVQTLHLAGMLAQGQGRIEDSAASFRQALRLNPDDAVALNGLGVTRLQLGQLPQAAACFERALHVAPDYPDAWYNLGFTRHNEGRLNEAAVHFQQALRLRPDFPEAINSLGVTRVYQGDLDAAETAFRRVLRASPRHVLALVNLAGVRQAQGLVDEATQLYRRAIELHPDNPSVRSSYLNTLQYRADVTLAGLCAAHAEFERICAAPLRAAWRTHGNPPLPDRPLRVGFVSPNFTRHAVGHFLVGLLENLDPAVCETVCYSDSVSPDATTERLRRAASLWRETFAASDAGLAEQIRSDAIDVLFDLAGHTAGNRLLAFAHRPAPVQITWLDYVGTTGLAAMDYLLADANEVPPGAEAQYAERVLRMPDDYICYAPPADAPPVGPLPAFETGRVTLGSFNNPAKISPPCVAVWSRILARLPEARLVLKYRGFGSRSADEHFRRLFAEQGVDPERVALVGGSPPAEFLACYNRVDLALDTFPYNGGLTTCEALWMGVPVVTCPGETFAGRHSLAHLCAAGVTETIAKDLDHYVDVAVGWASDLPRLAALRARLRERVAASPLCDARRFAANFLLVVRRAWSDWCAAQRAVSAPGSVSTNA